MESLTGQVAMTLRHGQSVSLVHPDGTVCVVAPTPKQVGKCHIVIIAPKAVRIERDKETADEIERLRTERDEARRRICEMEAECIVFPPCSPQQYAVRMDWDCFKEEP